jgi:AraC-like DNA-binding protein
VKADSFPGLVVHVERGRSALRVVARAPENQPAVVVEAIFSGGTDGVWFRLTEGAEIRFFSRDEVARHPALSAVLRLIADEVDSTRPRASRTESEALLAHLFRSLLVYVGRISTPVPLPTWGRPFRDARVEKALELLNVDISKRWTVELLARAVGLSRPALARQFVRTVGLSPMRYLTQRRMQIAASLLLASDAALAEVAGRVGYQSEFAFNRAFRRHHRVPPGIFRQQPPNALCIAHAIAA